MSRGLKYHQELHSFIDSISFATLKQWNGAMEASSLQEFEQKKIFNDLCLVLVRPFFPVLKGAGGASHQHSLIGGAPTSLQNVFHNSTRQICRFQEQSKDPITLIACEAAPCWQETSRKLLFERPLNKFGASERITSEMQTHANFDHMPQVKPRVQYLSVEGLGHFYMLLLTRNLL